MAPLLPDLSTSRSADDRPYHDYILADGSIRDRARDNMRVRVKLTKEQMRIGCAVISLDAVRFILQKHAEAFAETKELEL